MCEKQFIPNLNITTNIKHGILRMKIETSISILNKEREFLGMTFLGLLVDIQKEQSTFPGMVYSPKVI